VKAIIKTPNKLGEIGGANYEFREQNGKAT